MNDDKNFDRFDGENFNGRAGLQCVVVSVQGTGSCSYLKTRYCDVQGE